MKIEKVLDGMEDKAQLHSKKVCLTLFYYWGVVGLGLASAVVGPTLETLGRATEIHNIGVLSYIFVLRALFYFLGSTTAGWFVTKYGHGYEILVGALAWSGGTLFFIPLIRGPKALFAAFCLQGLGSGVLTNIPQAMVIDLWGQKVGPFLQALHFFYGVGATLAPLLVHSLLIRGVDDASTAVSATAASSAQVLVDRYVLGAYWWIAGYHILGSVLMVYFVDIKRFVGDDTLSRNDRDEGNDLKKKEANIDSVVLPGEESALLPPSESSTSVTRRKEGNRKKSAFANPASTLTVILMSVFIFLYVGNEVASGGLLFTFATRSAFAFPPTRAALLTTTYWASFSLGRLLSIPIAAVLSPKTLLTAALLGVFASVVALRRSVGDDDAHREDGLLLTDGVVARSITLLWISVCALGMSNGPIYASAIVVLEEHVQVTGNVISAIVAGDTLGEMVVPGYIGWGMASYGPSFFVDGVAGASLSATALYAAVYFFLLRARV